MKKIRELFSRMKQDNGGYAAITTVMICIFVIGAFVGVTLSLVERNYTAQKKQFAQQTLIYQARGDIEAFRGELEALTDGTDLKNAIIAIHVGEASVKNTVNDPFNPNLTGLSEDTHTAVVTIPIVSSYSMKPDEAHITTATVDANLTCTIIGKNDYDTNPSITVTTAYQNITTDVETRLVTEGEAE